MLKFSQNILLVLNRNSLLSTCTQEMYLLFQECKDSAFLCIYICKIFISKQTELCIPLQQVRCLCQQLEILQTSEMG